MHVLMRYQTCVFKRFTLSKFTFFLAWRKPLILLNRQPVNLVSSSQLSFCTFVYLFSWNQIWCIIRIIITSSALLHVILFHLPWSTIVALIALCDLNKPKHIKTSGNYGKEHLWHCRLSLALHIVVGHAKFVIVLVRLEIAWYIVNIPFFVSKLKRNGVLFEHKSSEQSSRMMCNISLVVRSSM